MSFKVGDRVTGNSIPSGQHREGVITDLGYTSQGMVEVITDDGVMYMLDLPSVQLATSSPTPGFKVGDEVEFCLPSSIPSPSHPIDNAWFGRCGRIAKALTKEHKLTIYITNIDTNAGDSMSIKLCVTPPTAGQNACFVHPSWIRLVTKKETVICHTFEQTKGLDLLCGTAGDGVVGGWDYLQTERNFIKV